MSGKAETDVRHAWLPTVVPAATRRVLVAEESLAEVLLDAGADLVRDRPDLEVGPAPLLGGAAPVAVSPLGDPDPDASSLAQRVRSRARSASLVRIESTRALRRLRRLGYSHTEVFAWDLGHRVALGDRGQRSLAERLPRRAVVIGRRGPRTQTLLAAAVEDAASVVGRPLRLEWASARAGPTTAALDDGLLRIAVGPSRGQLQRQAAAHSSLREAGLPPRAVGLVVWVEAQGRTGLADWSLERRLPGGTPSPSFPAPLVAACVDFLVLLHGAEGTDEPRRTATAMAETAAGFLASGDAREIASLGERLDAALAGVPRGFAHGDFFRGNLLVEDGRLVGVVDWDAASPGRFPLTDLLHLRHMNEHRPADLDWGPTLVEHLLPWARRGGDEPAREYCLRLGMEPGPDLLEQLVVVYWLDRLGYQLSTYADRAARPRWLERNVSHVLHALAPRVPPT